MVNVSMNVKDLYQSKHHWCSCKVCIEVVIIDYNQHPCANSQRNKNMTTSHLNISLHILIIFKLHMTSVYG